MSFLIAIVIPTSWLRLPLNERLLRTIRLRKYIHSWRKPTLGWLPSSIGSEVDTCASFSSAGERYLLFTSLRPVAELGYEVLDVLPEEAVYDDWYDPGPT